MLLFKLLCIHKYKICFAKDYFCAFIIKNCRMFFLMNQIIVLLENDYCINLFVDLILK